MGIIDQIIKRAALIGYNSRADNHIEKLRDIRWKLAWFIDTYPGQVRGETAIPYSHSSKTDLPPYGEFVKFYVRSEFSNGYTEFEWFNTMENAKRYIQLRLKLRKDFIKAIGPYPIPFNSGEHFR